jgi:hypothetical protein
MGRRYVINQKNLAQFVCAAGRKDSLFFVDGERGLALRCTVAGGQSWIFQYVSPLKQLVEEYRCKGRLYNNTFFTKRNAQKTKIHKTLVLGYNPL